MSGMLYAIIKYDGNTSEEAISDSCFAFVKEACTKRIAIETISKEVQMWEHTGKQWERKDYFNFVTPINYILNSLSKNEIVIELSNSYVYGEAEAFLNDDHSIPSPSHIERLKNLQELLEYIFDISIVEELNVYICDDYYEEDDFETIGCQVSDFALIMKEKLFQKFSFAYKYVITKSDCDTRTI